MLTKVCRDCGRELPLGRFYKNRDKGIASMKKAVLRDGILWDLDEGYLRSIFTGVCPVFGCAIHVGGIKDDCKAELDRLVPSKGYVKGNVRWISRRANRIKSDATIDELKKILKYMEE